jgi:colanic acid/amylovoran biosynthesis protein
MIPNAYPDKKRFCLLGASFTTSNMGVSALTAGIIESIIHNHPEAEITLLDYGKDPITYKFKTNNREIPIQLLNIRFSQKVYLKNNIAFLILLSSLLKVIPIKVIRKIIIDSNPCLNYLYKADVVTSIAGGDSFSDIYGLLRLLYVSLPQLLVLFLNKRLILLPQTIGPFKAIISKFIARYILNRANIVYSRDHSGLIETKDLMKEKNLPSNLRFCHDVGFVVAPIKPIKMDLGDLPELNKITQDIVGLNVSGLLFMGGYTRNNMFGLKSNYQELIYDLIDVLIKKKGLSVLLVPHVFGHGKNSESDSTVCENIYEQLKLKYPDKLFLVKGNYDQSEIKYIIGMCNFFIGARMHACIAALSQCIPAVGIAYSKKFQGVFETVGVGNLVADPRTMEKEEIIKVICDAFQNRMIIKAKLQLLIPKVRNNVFEIFKDIDSKSVTTQYEGTRRELK